MPLDSLENITRQMLTVGRKNVRLSTQKLHKFNMSMKSKQKP